jgi:hypothetical protein
MPYFAGNVYVFLYLSSLYLGKNLKTVHVSLLGGERVCGDQRSRGAWQEEGSKDSLVVMETQVGVPEYLATVEEVEVGLGE